MKKDELTTLGLTEEQADKVLALNGRDIEKHKKAAEDAKAENATLTQQLASSRPPPAARRRPSSS